MTVVQMTRVFRFGATDLPDPDADLTPEQVMDHYAAQYPSLRQGKIDQGEAQGDRLVFTMKASEYKPNG